MKSIRFQIPILTVLLFCSGLMAGDFMTLPRTPKPDELNDSGIPIYESKYDGNELPNDCTEAIGEEGAELYCSEMGWTKLLTAPDKGTVTQGFDQVWKDEDRDVVIVVEAKGRKYKGVSGHDFRLTRTRGQYQASVEWCLEVCRAVRQSKKATEKSREVAEIVLEAISEDRFESRIIVTNHIEGTPYDTWTERIVREVPEEYIGKTADQLCYLVLQESDKPEKYGDDFDMIKYGTEWERQQLRAKVGGSLKEAVGEDEERESIEPVKQPKKPKPEQKRKSKKKSRVTG